MAPSAIATTWSSASPSASTASVPCSSTRSATRRAASFTTATAVASSRMPLLASTSPRSASRSARARSCSPSRPRSASQSGNQSRSCSRSTLLISSCTSRSGGGAALGTSYRGIAPILDTSTLPVVVLRRILFPLRLARARLGAGGERLLLVAVGVVAGAAVLAAVLAGRLVMQDRALVQAAHALSPGDREVQVVWSGATDQFAQLNRLVAPRMTALTGEHPVAAMLFRESSIQGRLVNVRAADDLNRYVNLISGRLPTRCVPTHCEVLRLKGTGQIHSTRYL